MRHFSLIKSSPYNPNNILYFFCSNYKTQTKSSNKQSSINPRVLGTTKYDEQINPIYIYLISMNKYRVNSHKIIKL